MGKFLIKNLEHKVDIEEYFRKKPFEFYHQEKCELFNELFFVLVRHHREMCEFYDRFLSAYNFNSDLKFDYRKLPSLPVEIFKNLKISSVESEKIITKLTSSGTSGRNVSQIYIDRKTALRQSIALNKIITNFLGNYKRPMIVIDSEEYGEKSSTLTARSAGIIGFSQISSDTIFVLDKNYKLNIDRLFTFLDKHRGKEILIFGFTFLIFYNFLSELVEIGKKLDLQNSILVHGGGWKKLKNRSVGEDAFKEKILNVCNIRRVYDYYGMAEQTGSIYFDCEYGHKHASIFSDILIRNSLDFSEAPIGEVGLIQTLSIIPTSYPGHSLLTADQGVIIGIDDCPCGRLGKYFKVLGRVARAEVRGCSDAYI